MRFDPLTLLVLVRKDVVVRLVENRARIGHQPSKDVPCARVVASSCQPRSELPAGKEQVQVVGSYEVLRHVDNRVFQGLLPVVVRSLLADVPHELCHLDVLFDLFLERAEYDFSLPGLEPVDHVRDRAKRRVLGEPDQLLVHEIGKRELLLVVVDGVGLLRAIHPVLAVVGTGLVEREIHGLLGGVIVREFDLVHLDVPEIFLRLLRSRGPKTLVVLDVPALAIVVLALPQFVVRKRVELLFVLPAFVHFDDRRHELFQESPVLHQARPPRLDQIDEQTLDVATVQILVRHDHDAAVAELVQVVILHAGSQAHDLQDSLNLGVLQQRSVRSLANVEQFTAQGKHAIEIATDHGETGDRKRLRGVSFRENQRALRRFFSTRLVRVFEFRNSENSHLVARTLQFSPQIHLFLGLGPVDDHINHARFLNVFDECVREFALRSELRRLSLQRLLRLRIKRRILHQAIYEYPQVLFYVRRFDRHPLLVSRLRFFQQNLHELLRHVRDVCTPLYRVYGIHKRDLLKLLLEREGDANLPSGAALLVHDGKGLVSLGDFGRRRRLDEEFAIRLEVGDRKPLVVQENLASFIRGCCDVPYALVEKSDCVVVEFSHVEFREIRRERHSRVRFLFVLLNFRLVLHAHVVFHHLREALLFLGIRRLDHKLFREHVRQLCAEPVAPACHLLLVVVVVVGGEEVPKNQLRHVNLMLLVHHHRHSGAVVVDRNGAVELVDLYVDHVHGGRPLEVVGGVHEDLVKDFVQRGTVRDFSELHGLGRLVENPHLLHLGLAGPDIGVRTEEDVL
mmetsp:Transcript_13832/g.34094  ORF Transcript_13832/g.34094 Transcript_13832/m.34094 type:complete len:794 (+) Transcript_13832:3553-5934(+)